VTVISWFQAHEQNGHAQTQWNIFFCGCLTSGCVEDSKYTHVSHSESHSPDFSVSNMISGSGKYTSVSLFVTCSCGGLWEANRSEASKWIPLLNYRTSWVESKILSMSMNIIWSSLVILLHHGYVTTWLLFGPRGKVLGLWMIWFKNRVYQMYISKSMKNVIWWSGHNLAS
jgi:hypothetical protein